MVEGWEERREAADSVFLFPVVCWLSVMRPHLRPQRPAIGQGIRWLPRDARRAGPPRHAETQKTSFQKWWRKEERPAMTGRLQDCVWCSSGKFIVAYIVRVLRWCSHTFLFFWFFTNIGVLSMTTTTSFCDQSEHQILFSFTVTQHRRGWGKVNTMHVLIDDLLITSTPNQF